MRRIFCGMLLATLLVSPAFSREWTDAAGERTVEAEFVSLDGSVVLFRLPDGQVRRCELERLSPADQAFAKEAGAAQVAAADEPASDAPQTNTAREVNELPVPTQLVSTAVNATVIKTAAANPTTATNTAAATTAAGAPCAGPCQPAMQTVECTVMVPQMSTETRTVLETAYRAEQRQKTYNVCRQVPETHQVSYEYTVPTYETRSREYTYNVCKPVVTSQEQQFTVMVPHNETRTGTRQVCRMIEVPMTRTVCEDKGSWQQVSKPAPCGGCGGCGGCGETSGCTITCNVWVPNIVKREVPYTVMRPHTETVPYTYTALVCRPETRTKTVQVTNYVTEQQKKTVPYTVCVPVKKVGTRDVTTWKTVSEPKTVNYNVCIPYTVEKQVQVQVCHMVPKKVTYQVPACGTGCGGGGCGGCGGCR